MVDAVTKGVDYGRKVVEEMARGGTAVGLGDRMRRVGRSRDGGTGSTGCTVPMTGLK